MVESDKSRQATPITFKWTGINYPQQWEVKYQELRNADYLQRSILNKPLPLIIKPVLSDYQNKPLLLSSHRLSSDQLLYLLITMHGDRSNPTLSLHLSLPLLPTSAYTKQNIMANTKIAQHAGKYCRRSNTKSKEKPQL